jgi:N-methylhydantoinase A
MTAAAGKELRVAVDVGGTFTDLCVFEGPDKPLRIAKVPSTADPIEGVIAALRQADVALEQTALFAHGTTVATNALIERDLARTAMVTTRGFRDVIEIRRGTKDDLWDTYKDVPPPYVRRRDRHEVTERMLFSGEVRTALDEAEARELARVLGRREVQSIAVCFINSYANPAHEERMREILLEELAGVDVTISSEVVPQIFEHERFSTAVINAALAPKVGTYVGELGDRVAELGYDGDVLLLHSGGGVMTARTASRYSARLAASGIVAGAIAARHVGRLAGFENVIGLDMGGTSTDISLVYGGELRTRSEWSVEYGYPICFPSVEVLTIGAGGGSLAWIDDADSLRNGPQSAGSRPGPACYGQGGERPTNTDANLFLGRLGGRLAGGTLELDRDLAASAIERHVAQPLGLEAAQAAEAIIRIANANMADAVRLVSVRRGYDPREFALVVFGGAGPLHGTALARELSIPVVVVPPNPGLTSALGCLLVDIRHDLSTMYLVDAADADPDDVERRFRELEDEARARLDAEGVEVEGATLERIVDMRYTGQWRSMSVTFVPGPDALERAVADFHAEHAREYNFRRDDAPVEIFRLAVRAMGTTPKPDLRAPSSANGASPAPIDSRSVVFDGEPSTIDAPVYRRADLHPGATVTGPALIDQLDSTVLVEPGVTATVDEYLNLRLTWED